MVQLMPLPLTVSCCSKIQIGFTFLVPAYPGSPGQRAVKRVCVCVCLQSIRSQAALIKPSICSRIKRDGRADGERPMHMVDSSVLLLYCSACRTTRWVDAMCGSGQIGTVKTGMWGGKCRSGLISTVWQGWTMREVRLT